ncbi:winged helix-turn-helix transcriptional regulator [Mobilitalea sibirica]|uniref:Winged helix-turn-helix transcriptional regulator n=1 Tax=Mobilitalea sibirica TaxID=1462919 RepID=A0A8J7H9A4_9FIRM|nr:winged helix-turn-helix transcriptional regulator [Mobilitalea sibirica]
MIDIFKALSEESRLRILALLMDRELCVCEIEASLNMSQSNASRQLAILKNSDILDVNKKAQWAYYKISEDFIQKHRELYQYLRVRLKEIPTYHKDIDECEKCCKQNLCSNIRNENEL